MRAHHGSLSREQRLQVESDLKGGRLRAIVATSSLELGIDMGAVDLVVLVESPGSVSRGLQRIGRAGHQVGEPSSGKIFPKYRGDLLEAAVVVERMRDGLVEEMRYPRNPLDVLAQQIVAAAALDEWDVDDLLALARRAANFADLSDDVFRETLDMLAGRYPSDQFAGLRPRVVWDRAQNRVRARQGAQHVAVASGGTIPDRGLFGVFLPDGARVGELDEEMVYESRVGEAFVLGASTWRIEEITFDRVIVTPAPGEPAKTPFWRGDKPGRPLELGRALGALVRELRDRPDDAELRLTTSGLDARASGNLRAFLDEQAEATGAVPDDRTIVVERFADEIGDWRVCILTPFGARVHAPWALAIEEKLARLDLPVQVLWSDDGIICRLPETLEEIPLDVLLVDPDELDELVVTRVPSTSLFASRFRENAARALLLPRRRPGERTPLWQQRQRAAGLLEVASGYPTFPILLETTRECLRDVFDLPALREVLTDIRSRRVRVVPVETRHASPFAQSLLFGWIAVYMYEGDAPLAERRVAALALDRDLLRDLLGAEELRELLDPAVIARAGARAAAAHPRTAGAPRRRPPRPPRRPRPAGRRRGGGAQRDRPGPVDRHAGARAADHPRRRPARRGRGRGAPARRDRARDPGRAAGRVHRPGAAAARRPGVALRPHPRSVRARRRGGAARGHGRAGLGRPATTRGRGPGRARRVPTRWIRARVVRRRRAALAPAALARRAAPRGRAGRRAHVRTLPVRVAERRPRAAGHRRVGRSARTAPGRRDPGVGARTRRAAGARRGLQARDARRAVRGGRAGLDRSGRAGRGRRTGASLLPGPGEAARVVGHAARAAGRPGARRHPRATGVGRRVVLARPGHRGRHGRRRGAAHRALGPRVGGRGHERHVRSAARPAARRPPSARHAAGPIPAGWRGSGRPRGRAAGRWSHRCSNRRPPPPRPRTRSRDNCSNGTASSPARR